MAAKQDENKQLKRVFRRTMMVVGIFLVLFLSAAGYRFFYDVFADESVDAADEGTEVSVRIDSGMSTLDVGKTLQQYGLVDSAYIFYAQAKLFLDSDVDTIQTGTYTLSSSMNAEEILAVITGQESGDTEE